MLRDFCLCYTQEKYPEDVGTKGRNSSGPGKVIASSGGGLIGVSTCREPTKCVYCGSDAIHALRKELNEQLSEQKRQLDEKLDKILMIVSNLKVSENESSSYPVQHTTPVAAALSARILKSREDSRSLSQRKADRYDCNGVMASLCFPENLQSREREPSEAE
jgi:hypothetical protein